MLIGQTLQLSFARYLVDGGVPALAGLAVVWTGVWWGYRRHWRGAAKLPEIEAPAFDRWQSAKGIAVAIALISMFLVAPWPREVVALAGAAVILVSRRMASREMLGLVDWHLLVLFVSLFVVNAAVASSGVLGGILMTFRMAGLSLTDPATLFGITALLSNLGIQRPCRHAAAAGSGSRTGWTSAGTVLDAGRKPDHRRQHREHHRRRSGSAAWDHDRLADARARRRAGDDRHAGDSRVVGAAVSGR
jgi:hypothetical protein